MVAWYALDKSLLAPKVDGTPRDYEFNTVTSAMGAQLLVAFGLANELASIPITPGGLGIVEGVYIPTLVGFGVPVATATVTVLTYRIAQFWLPILVGAVSYASLRIGAVPAVPTP